MEGAEFGGETALVEVGAALELEGVALGPGGNDVVLRVVTPEIGGEAAGAVAKLDRDKRIAVGRGLDGGLADKQDGRERLARAEGLEIGNGGEGVVVRHGISPVE